ncbi:MAG: hypothetical protein ACJ8C4_19750 [Gemmataceae bacterium]
MHELLLMLTLLAAWPGDRNPLPAILPDPSANNLASMDLLAGTISERSSLTPAVSIRATEIPTSPQPLTEWLALSGKQAVRDAHVSRDDVVKSDSTWATGESIKVPVAGPLYVFGSVDAGSESVEQQQFRWAGKTGVGVKVHPWIVEEVQVRGGPAVYCDDPDHPRTYMPERHEVFLEASTQVPVPIWGRPVALEYNGTSAPTTTPHEKPKLNQDIKLAVPLPDGRSKVSVGTTIAPPDTPTSPTPWFDRAQLYLGVELKH